MKITFEKFKTYLESIEDAPKELVHATVESLTKIMDDKDGYIHHFVFNLAFGNVPFPQLMLSGNGEAVDIENIEKLWELLNFNK